MNDDFTVGDLRRALAGLPDNMELGFHAGLTFYRVKRWSDHKVGIEFNEFEADLTPAFRKRNPDIIAAFCRFPENDAEENKLQVSYVPKL